MKTSKLFSHRFHIRPRAVFIGFLFSATLSALAAAPNASFIVEFSGNANTPTVKVINKSRDPITRVELTIGNTAKNFDTSHTIPARIDPPSGGTATLDSGDRRRNMIGFAVTDFGYNEDLEFGIDIDRDASPQDTGEDYRKVLFNNGTGGANNAILTVTTSAGEESLQFPDGSTSQSFYRFESESQPRNLTVSSSSGIEGSGGIYVPFCTVQIGDILHTNIGQNLDIEVYQGETVEIFVPEIVYLDNADDYVTDSSDFHSDTLTNAMQRFVAIGMAVNDIPQSGDPALYRFTMEDDTDVEAKWRHDYALRVKSDFTETKSRLNDLGGPSISDDDAWVGPVESDAAGNPDPAVKLHWIPKGETIIANIDGQVVDNTHPGLAVRFVPTGYQAAGSAIKNRTASIFETASYPFTVGQAPIQRQQVHDFVMDGPAEIEYVWRLQYGVTVNVDDVARTRLPLVREIIDGTTNDYFGEGTVWFNPSTNQNVQVLCRAEDDDKALAGWINGDGYYFKSSGEIFTPDGSLVEGEPDECTWISNTVVSVVEGSETNVYSFHGMNITSGGGFPGIRRPGRVMWTYGNPAFAVDVDIGEYVLQEAVTNNHGIFNGETFQDEPSQIRLISVSGRNTQVEEANITIWDDTAKKLYPLVPGLFRVTWSNETESIDVLVTSVYPQTPHYPHITSTPPVNLDPDSGDSFVYKDVRYSENEASVDENSYFRAEIPGWTVLLFGEIQLVGRGEPREFLRVRTVETKTWQDCLTNDTEVIIGQAIIDDDLDLAKLETGYVFFENARYNPLVYDAEKLDGLAVQDVYDMDLLQSTTHELDVIQPDSLPGPVIPVNLHPGALAEDRIVIAWYDDPAMNDNMLWPYAVRTYLPRWPVNADEGLGRIVIASQHGSESLGSDGAEQVVVGGLTNLSVDSSGTTITNIFDEENTYNPSRLQQVQVYSQDDATTAGYNPNEEHALTAPSLKNAAVSPRPPAVYALRDNDLNRHKENKPYTEEGQPSDYTSDPFVLVQFFDTAEQTYKMRVYEVVAEDNRYAGHSFADSDEWRVNEPRAAVLRGEPHVVMEAGEPVIPFYPLGQVWGAVVPPETSGSNITSQLTYWEDHKGTSWAVSGGTNAWFTQLPYYPLQPDFWWPGNEPGVIAIDEDENVQAFVPMVGNSLAFLPENIASLRALSDGNTVSDDINDENVPVEILYKSDWPAIAPILKAGETLTFSGGEYRADHPTSLVLNDEGELETVETPGLPGVLAFAAAEVVFDSLNPDGESNLLRTKWTARVAQVLEKRTVDMSSGEFPGALAPASGRTRISGGKYVFTELPASLQRRFRYDPVNGKLEIFGLLNDKDIGNDTLTASPPQVYVLEPNIMTAADLLALRELDGSSAWRTAVGGLYNATRNPSELKNGDTVIQGEYLVGLQRKIVRFPGTGEPILLPIDSDGDGVPNWESDILEPLRAPGTPEPLQAMGPGLAVLPNSDFLDPTADVPDVSWITVVENNDSTLGGSPVTPHVIKVDRTERYRGAIKTVLSDNVFDENVVLRHQGDFGANADSLYFEWWYRPDDGSLNVPPPDDPQWNIQPNPWKLFPDLTGEQGRARYETMLKGNPNAPEALLADTWWFCRYRHENDIVSGIDWAVTQTDGKDEVNFTWAGAGNSDPLGAYNNGVPDYKAQLVMGWIKRVLDAVNPYEARIRDFEGDSPSTVVSMISQFGARFEGPVALNPDKNVIENVGLIELYETILKRGKDLSIDLSRPVSTPAIANALQLAATRISDFYTLLANEAYTDALDPTIGHGSESAAYGDLAPSVFAFQNQMSSLIEEELALLRGVDENFARPFYNRLFPNFTKGEGEAAYAVNYNIADVNMDGFVDEDDAMITFPQGHGDAWGHYLTALRNQYDLLSHKYFNWVSRSEFYNLMDIVIKVDFLDERKFAQMAAAKAQAGAEVVDLTYREKYVEDPEAQWQGYTDSDELRGWGVQGWARRAGQGAYFDWITANALLPSGHPNETLEGIQKVDRKSNDDIAVISANLNRIQRTFDHANSGYNPLGISKDAVPMDIDPQYISFGRTDLATHFGQMYDRAVKALNNAKSTWDHANKIENMLRKIGTTETDYRNKTFQQDLSYRNKLIQIFGRPYEGTIGSGKLYPAGYDGPDLALHMYIGVREINNDTVPGPAASFASFDDWGDLDGGAMDELLSWTTPSLHSLNLLNFDVNYLGPPHAMSLDVASSWRKLYAPSFAGDFSAADGGGVAAKVEDGLYSVNYTDLEDPKVPLENLTDLMPVTTAGYTFQAPEVWGSRLSEGKLQQQLSAMLQQEAAIASAIASWDGLTGNIIRTLRLTNAQWVSADAVQLKNEIFSRFKKGIQGTIKAIRAVRAWKKAASETTYRVFDTAEEATPEHLPTGGVAVSPGDALFAVDAGFEVAKTTAFIGSKVVEAKLDLFEAAMGIILDAAENELNLWEKREKLALSKKEWLKKIEDLVGDEPAKRVAVFKAVEGLRAKSEQYRTMLDEGARLIDERAAFNKRVAAQIQRNRYRDMTFRVSLNHALENYRQAFDLAAKYAYLAAKAYDYETNFDPSDPYSAQPHLQEIVRARSLGLVSSGPKIGAGGLAETLAKMKANFDVLYGQMGLSNPQWDNGRVSLRTGNFRILPQGEIQPEGDDNYPSPGGTSDDLWKQTLYSSTVDDLWEVPEFRQYCRAFASEYDVDDEYDPQPGVVIRFSTTIKSGENIFGRPLLGNDYSYDPSLYSTRIRGAGVWFADYDDNLLAVAPRVYLIPVGADIMSVANSPDPGVVRVWNVVDQSIPAPYPAESSDLDNSSWVPLYDTLSGQYGEIRRFSSFRAYGGVEGEPNYNSRLVGRSVWNTEWVLIIPGITFYYDAEEGLQRFIDQVSDIELVFDTYGYSGN